MPSPVRITSAAHRVLKLARELSTPRGRKKRGLVLLEGLRAVESAGATATGGGEAALVTARVLATERGRAAAAVLQGRGVPVFEVTEPAFRGISLVEAPQGIAVLCRPPRVTLARALAAEFVVVADRLQDPGNLGTLLRCALAFGAGAVVTTRGTVEVWNPKTVRAAAGAWPGLPVAEGAGPAELATGLGAGGRRVLAADPAGGRDFRDAVWRGSVALILGSEGHGVDPRLLALAGERVRIPLSGAVESLNVTAAAAVLLAEASRQRAAAP